jgi:SP family sugar:H+ symporter-like MFS transporter
MAGGPAVTGGGIGANAPKSKFAGILMVRTTLNLSIRR